MTYLETLVRTLPRQRRALDQQAAVGIGMLIVGYVITGLAVALAEWLGINGLLIMMGVVGAQIMLWGGYRYTKADLMREENAAMLLGVRQALKDNNPGQFTFSIVATTDDFEAEVRRALERTRRYDKRSDLRR